MSALHKGLADGRWQTFSILEQMGNIGSEVGRAINRLAHGETEQRDKALERALELFDFTLSDPRWHGPRLREIARAREIVCDFFYGDNTYQETPEKIEKYFMQFAQAARQKRERARQ